MTRHGIALASSAVPLADAHDVVLLDLDGVVYIGPAPVPRAVEVVNSLEVPVVYLTNNATRAAIEVGDHLRSFGLSLTDDAVVTAGQVVATLVRDAVGAGATVLLAGADGMRIALEDAGLRVVSSLADRPVAVVQGGVIDVRWSELAEASYAVASGLPWFASNPDLTFPTPRGLAPGNGAMVRAVALATDAAPVVAGKPGRPIYDEARRRTGARQPLMVGDRLDTDIDGAIAAEIASLAVLTGVNTLQDVADAVPGHRPSFVASDLDGLLVEHPPVELGDEVARCAGAMVRAEADELRLTSGDPGSVPALRAAIGLAWAIRDRSGEQVRVDGMMGA